MLQQLGEYISACLQRADQCREAAAAETDDRVRGQFLALEQQWQHVAKSYEFIETLEHSYAPATLCGPKLRYCRRTFPRSRRARTISGVTLSTATPEHFPQFRV